MQAIFKCRELRLGRASCGTMQSRIGCMSLRHVHCCGTRLSADVTQQAELWLQLDQNPVTRKQLIELLDADAETELQDMLCKRLEFGTAGLRGRMGAGFNRMNSVVVQQTAQGLCAYLHQQCPDTLAVHGIVVGFDARHGSREFALITAAVFLSRNVPVHLFQEFVPTPLVAAGVEVLGAAAGIMVTASHNPKADNGYKVYWGNGCQIIPPHDEGIAAAIAANLQLWPLPCGSADVASHPTTSDPTFTVCKAYYSRLRDHLVYRSRLDNSAAQPVVYTPLHGVGSAFVQRAFQEFGLPPLVVVPRQASPDPEFPTVVFPNPEEGAGTWALAFETGREAGARLIIANDPDADRLALAEKDDTLPSGYRPFSGNETGALLAHWMWTNHRRRHPEVPPTDVAMLASAVSSKFLRSMATTEGFLFQETLTGFKWLGNVALQLEGRAGDGAPGSSRVQVLFAFEEALGYMLGHMYKDKDGVAAAAVAAEMAAELYAGGSSLAQHLSQLYTLYGHHVTRASYFVTDRPEKTRAVFERLRRNGNYATSLAGVPVVAVRDLGTGLDTSRADGCASLPWREGELMITYSLEGGATLTVRASGTEPKLKYYLEVVSSDMAAAHGLAERLAVAVADELVQVQAAGLLLPQQHA